MKTANDYEQFIHICPDLRRFTSYGDYPFKMPIVVFLDPIHHPKLINTADNVAVEMWICGTCGVQQTH
jgi:hypothetical protein